MPEESIPLTISDEERLLRSIRDDPLLYQCDAGGRLLRLSHSAFNDRSREPSVDRELYVTGGVSATRKSESDGVVPLITGSIRAISSVVSMDSKARPIQTHVVDAKYDPLPENVAHALIRTDPAVSSDGAFKKLKEALCRIAERQGWCFQPLTFRR